VQQCTGDSPKFPNKAPFSKPAGSKRLGEEDYSTSLLVCDKEICKSAVPANGEPIAHSANESQLSFVIDRMLATLSLLIAFNTQATPIEILYKPSRLSSKDWAEVASYFIELGEEKAVTELKEKSSGKSGRVNTRTGLICRVLFEPKGSKPLRQPNLGTLALPYLSMPLSKWPHYPLVKENGIWFLLEENYQRSGSEETARAYIDYCQQEGRFRTEKVAVPTKEETVDALKSLLSSKRWADIRWSDSRRGIDYTYDRQWTVDILKAHTRFLP
jgi:hypothetical protein